MTKTEIDSNVWEEMKKNSPEEYEKVQKELKD